MQDSKNNTALPHNNLTQDKDKLSTDNINFTKEQINIESIQIDSTNDIENNIESTSLAQTTKAFENIKDTENMQTSSNTSKNSVAEIETNELDYYNEIPQDIKDIISDSMDSVFDIESASNDLELNIQREYKEDIEKEHTIESNNIHERHNDIKDLDITDLPYSVSLSDEVRDLRESNVTQKPKNSHNSQEIMQEDTKEIQQELHAEASKEYLFDDIVLQKPYSEAKPKKYKLEYLLYSKRVFIFLTCIALLVGIYAMYLFFGSTSLEVLLDLHKERDSLRIEVEQNRLDNATLQRHFLELRALEPRK